MKETQELRSLFKEYMSHVEDTEALKKLAEISACIDKVDSNIADMEDKSNQLKNDYIEALKHTSFKETETQTAPQATSFDDALQQLKEKLSNG